MEGVTIINNHKIAFIICTNNDMYMDECRYYIKRLLIPDGYDIQIVEIHDAQSMTAGYNIAMKKTDAKYKIFLHQDTYLIKRDLIRKLLDIFRNTAIGMVGVIGGDIQKDGGCHHYWSKGHTLNSTYENVVDFDYTTSDKNSTVSVEAVDGMFIATQYDLEWDERVNKWHMYDIAQAIRFHEAGYDIRVLNEKRPWTIHDAGFCSEAGYEEAMKLIATLYPNYFSFSCPDWKLITDDRNSICKEEIHRAVLDSEIMSYGIAKAPENLDDFYSLYFEVKKYIYRMIFGMPRTDWYGIVSLISSKKISVAFLMEVIKRCTPNPDNAAQEIEKLFTKPDPNKVFFDQYQRYHTAAELIRKDKNFSGIPRSTILEIGANAHKNLEKELCNDEIIYSDLNVPEEYRYDNRYIEVNACNMPQIDNNSFDYCVALDVLEHVNKESRIDLLKELFRVSKRAVIVSFPQGCTAVEEAEKNVNEYHKKIYGQDNPWLIEHINNGLPICDEIDSELCDSGIKFYRFFHGDIHLWEKITTINTLIDNDELNTAISELNFEYNRHFYSNDTGDVNYRVFYVLCKEADPQFLKISFGNEKIDSSFVDGVFQSIMQYV